MIVFIFLLVLNVVFVLCLAALYTFVIRRRAKIYLLVEHLASLARRNMPLQTGLRLLGQDLGGVFGIRLGRVARRIEEGQTLGESLQSAGRAFPSLLCGMVTLGERSGNLAGFLEEMRKSYRRMVEAPYQSVYYILYPVVLSMCINLALTLIYGSVVPKLNIILGQIGSKSWEHGWKYLIGANEAVLLLCILTSLLIVSGGISVHFGSSLLRFMKGTTDRLALWTPLLGRLVRDASIHHFSICVGLFLRAGGSLHESVRSAAETERNSVYRRRYEILATSLAEGGRLSELLRRDRFFPDDLVWFAETGEAAGKLPEHLLQAASHYDTKSRLGANIALRALVPIFVALNGGLVLGTCILAYHPINMALKRFIP